MFATQSTFVSNKKTTTKRIALKMSEETVIGSGEMEEDHDSENDDDDEPLDPKLPKAFSKSYMTKQCHNKNHYHNDGTPNFNSWLYEHFLLHDSGVDDVLEAPTFYPTEEEFNDPIKYIQQIYNTAMPYGMCKIVPPEGFELPTMLEKSAVNKKSFKFKTKIQNIHQLQNRFAKDEVDLKPVIALPPEPTVKGNSPKTNVAGVKRKRTEENNAAPEDSPLTKKPKLETVLSLQNLKEQIMELHDKKEPSRMIAGFGFLRGSFEFNLKTFEAMADKFLNDFFQQNIEYSVKHNRHEIVIPRPVQRRLARRGGLQRIRGVTYCDTLGDVSVSDVQCDYWRTIEKGAPAVSVHYGSDLDILKHGSAFKKSWSCNWNMARLPCLDDSLLKYIHQTIPGINSPMIYVGMLFSSFCWHTEDNYLYSVNYIHSGAPKTWYAYCVQ